MCRTSLFGVPSADYRFGGSVGIRRELDPLMLLTVYSTECAALFKQPFLD